ncbi:hypothetical protein SDC9_172351 [bioreactor metagenome]|uniref:Uncharacterized protein n=1 Tax=bioreactor metagenome TaxID=1076179 RepID=A0A645GE40_9ZZZZ
MLPVGGGQRHDNASAHAGAGAQPPLGAGHALSHHGLHQTGPDGAAANGQRRTQSHAAGLDAGKKAEVVDGHAKAAEQNTRPAYGLAHMASVQNHRQSDKEQRGHDHAKATHPVGRELCRREMLGRARGAPEHGGGQYQSHRAQSATGQGGRKS